jgi:hypothetical protein
MSYRFCLLFAFLLLGGAAAASPPLSDEAQRVQSAYARLKANPKSASAKLAYLRAFPTTKAAFIRVFNSADGGQLSATSHEHVATLKSVAHTYPQPVLALCFSIGKNLAWEADAVSSLQHASVEIGGLHPRTFAAEARKLKPTERVALFGFLADVENHQKYSEFHDLIKRLNESGDSDLGSGLEQAKQRRMRQPHG